MLGKHKQRLKELKIKESSFRWDIEEIKHADMDPDRKAIWLSDAECSHYLIELEIEEIEHKLAMIPLKLMLGGFIIFVIIMTIYMLS